MGNPAVELRNCSRHYRNGRGIFGVSLSFGPGVYGVLGPNGAGKTTLLELLATAAAPDSGTVAFWGTDVREARARALREIRGRVGYLPQDPVLPGHLTVAGYLDYVAVLRDVLPRAARRREVERVLDLVALGSRSRDRIRALSGGMRQRVALARALVGAPRLLVLDEPTVGLDPEQRVDLRDALLAMAADDVTVVVSSHETDDLAAVCSRLAVVVDGTLRWSGITSAFASGADGRVWISDEPAPAGAARSVRTTDNRFRHVGSRGDAPPVPATIEDAYLLLVAGAGPATGTGP
jgi:ABC-2 type transport system ATP-binding protein